MYIHLHTTFQSPFSIYKKVYRRASYHSLLHLATRVICTTAKLDVEIINLVNSERRRPRPSRSIDAYAHAVHKIRAEPVERQCATGRQADKLVAMGKALLRDVNFEVCGVD